MTEPSDPVDPIDPSRVVINSMVVACETMLGEMQKHGGGTVLWGIAEATLTDAKKEMDAFLTDGDFTHITKAETLMRNSDALLKRLQ